MQAGLKLVDLPIVLPWLLLPFICQPVQNWVDLLDRFDFRLQTLLFVDEWAEYVMGVWEGGLGVCIGLGQDGSWIYSWWHWSVSIISWFLEPYLLHDFRAESLNSVIHFVVEVSSVILSKTIVLRFILLRIVDLPLPSQVVGVQRLFRTKWLAESLDSDVVSIDSCRDRVVLVALGHWKRAALREPQARLFSVGMRCVCYGSHRTRSHWGLV